ncbi:MAG TPA: glycosyl transferase family 2, partial [Flavobacteriaceae bacterium]|nr:glycosyl transferase family 2 [Flavobacteriaceae bacterium]
MVAASSLFKTLLIIPFYNEEARIDRQALAQNFKEFSQLDFLLIDDGSQDQTPQILQSFAQEYKNVSVRKNDNNLGKAESLRQGVLSAEIKKYDYIGYLDADLATPISEIVRLLNYAEKNTDKK